MSTPSIEQQQNFWDDHWAIKWRERKTLNEWKDLRHEALMSRVASVRLNQPKIIDLGCGPGYYTRALAAFGPTTGLDLSEQAIAKARSKYPEIEFIAANLLDHPLPRAHYDIVVSQEAFDHVEDQDRFVDTAYDILVPGGYLILSCTNRFVTDRLKEGQVEDLSTDHVKKFLTMGEFKRILGRRFEVQHATSIIMHGTRGILRLVNSYKLNQILALVCTRKGLEALKGRFGLGYQLIGVARKPVNAMGPSDC